MPSTPASSRVQLTWHVAPAAAGGERHVAEFRHGGRAIGSARLWRPGPGASTAGAWPSRVWLNGIYERHFYEWFYEGWYVALQRPPLLIEAVDFDLDLDPTLDLEGLALLQAMKTLAVPGAAVVGPTLDLLPPGERARAKAAGLVAWASRVASRVYGGALVVAATDDVARAT